MKKIFFIAGTDTGIGKTYISCKILQHYNKKGLSTVGLKPVGTGGFIQNGKIVNEDALLLLENSSIKLPYEIVNPYSFLPPVSPHIACKNLSAVKISSKLQKIIHANNADIYVIEGAGGFQTPINNHETMADLSVSLNFPIILVIAIRLGALNHGILTYNAIKKLNLPIHGWVANIIDPDMIAIKENIKFLTQYIEAPLLDYGSIT